MQKKLLAGIIIGITIVGTIVTIQMAQAGMQDSDTCVSESMFEGFSKDVPLGRELAKASGMYLSDNRTIAYLYDDFSGYAGNQRLVDSFEDPAAWSTSTGKLELAGEYYGGSGALLYTAPKDIGQEITLHKALKVPENLQRWSQSGYFTMWIKIPDPAGVDSVNIVFEDESGNRRTLAPLQNVHSSAENTFKNDLEYPDLVYPEGNPKTEMWTDFVLAGGWNYFPWRADSYTDTGNMDMSKITGIYLSMQVNEKLAGQTLILDDLRIQDGLQKSSNPTKGMWYPPHGRPQYGVYDIDKKDDDTGYELRLLNIRNTQYPSNGDHARMISSHPVPMDFAMRVKFTLDQLGHEDEDLVLPSPFPAWTPKELREVPISKGGRDNTYFRITYDFEPSWDPGHEWFGAYLSLQYNRLGILTVWPLERNVLQDQEPQAGARTATTEFVPQAGVKYEMDLVAKGQFTSTTIYEVKDNGCLERKAGMSYIFEHPRHEWDKRYPLAIESTGNMRSIIHEVELISLEDLTANKVHQAPKLH